VRLFQYLPASADLYVKEEAAQLQRAVSGWGWSGQIATELGNANPQADDLLLYHHTASAAPDFSQIREGRTALILHDLPDDKQRLAQILPSIELCIAHCEKGCDLLQELGAKRIRQASYLFDSDETAPELDHDLAGQIAEAPRNLFFSGRLDDQINIKHLLMIAWYLSRFIEGSDEHWRLIIEGRADNQKQLQQEIELNTNHFKLDDSFLLVLDELSASQRSTVFAKADAYLTFDQEDFDGAAIHHAVAHQLPVFAASEAAPSDLLGEQIIAKPIISQMAEDIHRCTTDSSFKAALLAGQEKRFQTTNFKTTAYVLKSLFSRFNKK
jgi:hypothetical protein